jgi:hypothetical protein
MAKHHWSAAAIDGRQVNVALRDGTRIDDCQLVSCRPGSVKTLWIFSNGEDLLIPCDEVVDVWPLEDRAAA